jgi:hypothetical protein
LSGVSGAHAAVKAKICARSAAPVNAVYLGRLVAMTGASPAHGSHRAVNPAIGGIPGRGAVTTAAINGNSPGRGQAQNNRYGDTAALF